MLTNPFTGQTIRRVEETDDGALQAAADPEGEDTPGPQFDVADYGYVFRLA